MNPSPRSTAKPAHPAAELLELWEQDHKTVVFVTHDMEEALLLSDRVLVLSRQQVRCG